MSGRASKKDMTIGTYLRVSTTLFVEGIVGRVVNRGAILLVLRSIELRLLAVNLNRVVFAVERDDLVGQVFALFVLTVAAAESAVGLAVLVVYYRVRGTIARESVGVRQG